MRWVRTHFGFDSHHNSEEMELDRVKERSWLSQNRSSRPLPILAVSKSVEIRTGVWCQLFASFFAASVYPYGRERGLTAPCFSFGTFHSGSLVFDFLGFVFLVPDKSSNSPYRYRIACGPISFHSYLSAVNFKKAQMKEQI